jgi:hypothetical protein
MTPVNIQNKTKKIQFMSQLRCPYCKVKLLNYIYADECPSCSHELEYNKGRDDKTRVRDPLKLQPWPWRMFLRVVRFVES